MNTKIYAYSLEFRKKLNSFFLTKIQRKETKYAIEGRKLYWQRKAISDAGQIKGAEISEEQKRQAVDFYRSYTPINTCFHSFYYKCTGQFDKRYIPDDVYYAYIDPYFNSWREALFLDNKTYYANIFHGVKQPETVVSRCGGIWFSADGKPIDLKRAVDLICGAGEVFLKRATESEGGHGVFFINGDLDELVKILKAIEGDIIVQKALKQHSELNKLNASSVNTIRILTLLSGGGVKPYSAVVRMGIDGAKVDNASSGGITCGIDWDGHLKPAAYSSSGERYDVHPTSGVKFDSVVIPSFDRAVKLVQKLHVRLPHFRLLSWDIAIDEHGDPVLIEVNLRYGEIDFHQLNNGALFGDDTIKILNEVFGK